MALKKKPVTGMKDMLPAEMEIRDYVIQKTNFQDFKTWRKIKIRYSERRDGFGGWRSSL